MTMKMITIMNINILLLTILAYFVGIVKIYV